MIIKQFIFIVAFVWIHSNGCWNEQTTLPKWEWTKKDKTRVTLQRIPAMFGNFSLAIKTTTRKTMICHSVNPLIDWLTLVEGSFRNGTRAKGCSPFPIIVTVISWDKEKANWE